MFSRKTLLRILIFVAAFFAITSLFGVGEAYAQKRPLPSNTVSVQRADPEVAEIARNFGSLSKEEFLNWLATMQRRTVRSADARNQSITTYLSGCQSPVLKDGDDFYKLSERTRPALKLFRREGVIKFIVLVEAEPSIESLTGTSISVTTGLLSMIETDEELNSLVLHELAHEMSDEEHRKATMAGNLKALRRIEISCDAVSALSLKALDMNPRALGKILFKMISWSPESMQNNDGTRLHPSLASRLRLNELLSKALENQLVEAQYPPVEPGG